MQSLLSAERKSVVKLASTPTARNLTRVFFLQERLKGLGGKDHGIARVHVVGAGVMGGDIAAWSAYKGFEVTLADREQRFIDGALARAQELFAKRVKDEAKRPAVVCALARRSDRRRREERGPGDRGDHRTVRMRSARCTRKSNRTSSPMRC